MAGHEKQGIPTEPAGGNSVRSRILAAARGNFFIHGIRAVTMDDLAAELGMSKKTLYEHFSGKTTLVKAMILEKFREVESSLEQITSESPADFPGVLQRVLAYMQRHAGEIKPPFLRDIGREAPEILKLIETRRREVVQRFSRKLLDEGRAAGIVRRDIPAELVMEILLGAVQAIMNPTKMEQLDLTPHKGFTAIISVILEGIVTEKGRSGL